MNIIYQQPFNSDKKLGLAYNLACEAINDNEQWICLTDADTIFLNPHTTKKQIESIVEKYGNIFDLFTCYTNRIKNKQQRYNGIIDEDRDLVSLRNKVLKCETENYGNVTELKRLISGHFLLFKRKLQREFPFPLESKQGTMLAIDNRWSHQLLINNKRIARMDGVLLIHYYRMHNGINDKSHLL